MGGTEESHLEIIRQSFFEAAYLTSEVSSTPGFHVLVEILVLHLGHHLKY